jgi:phage recombination protein Bet
MSNQIAVMADRLSIDPQELNDIVMATVMPSTVQVTNEQFVSFLAIANEYKLNPLVREIFAFPAKGGGVQAVVSIDGWLKIILNHPNFNGMEHEDLLDNDGKLYAIKCSIYRKGQDRPISVTEYMNECVRNTEVWRSWPSRMLRHKATIQAGRYAFGISGIVEPDEAERAHEIKDVTPTKKHKILEESIQGVGEDWLKSTLADILNVDHPGKLSELYVSAMAECESHNDRDAAKKIKTECQKQKKYFEDLEDAQQA